MEAPVPFFFRVIACSVLSETFKSVILFNLQYGESQGQRSLVGCRLWGHKELDTAEVTCIFVCPQTDLVDVCSLIMPPFKGVLAYKERQCQRMLKLLHNCTHLTRW